MIHPDWFNFSDDTRIDPEAVSVPLARQDFLEVIQNDRRAWVLREVLDRDDGDGTDAGDLATARAAIETNTTPARVGGQARKRVYVALYQHHLPKLATAGLVEFLEDRGEIYATEATPDAVAALDVIETMVEGGDHLVDTPTEPDELVAENGGGAR